MNFARWSFLIAGVYGLLIITPMYFLESQLNIDYPPAITHPEYFYGFIGVTFAWQIAFIVISRDPIKYRMLMPVGIVEKVTYVVAVIVLYLQQRISPMVLSVGLIDLVLGTLFAISFIKVTALQSQKKQS